MKTTFLISFILSFVALTFTILLCCKPLMPFSNSANKNDSLAVADMSKLTAQAIEQATRLNVAVDVAINDRYGNILSVYRMNGSRDSNVNPLFGSITRARTAAYLSSNQHAFSSLTACYITRSHFPPATNNMPGGPLYGVVFSQLGGGDIQPNGGALQGVVPNGQPGLTGIPGGFPLYKNGVLIGGIGVAGGALDVSNTLATCSGVSVDETVALSALTGYAPNPNLTASNITVDGIALLYTNATALSQRYVANADSLLQTAGTFDKRYITTTLSRVVSQGYRVNPMAGSFLTVNDVSNIIGNASYRSAKTRAQIRRPPSSPARVWIAVVDVTGKVLGHWRDGDAAIFGMDVSVQKARTALAFSDPLNQFGTVIRKLLQIDPMQSLAVTTRAIGWLAQDFYPPGIDLPDGAAPGPLFEGANFSWQQRLAATPGLPPYGNGITIFPGGVPLYKAGILVGAIGVSGDGVDQDDYVAFAGAVGFEPWPQFRCDNFTYSGVRLPYLKFPRSPDLP